MGSIHEGARPKGNKLKIFDGPAIVVYRKGNAGSMTLIDKGRFTTNDDAYVITIEKDCKNKINLRWFIYQYQNLFQNIITSKSDNATFSKEYAKNQIISYPLKKKQDDIAERLIFLDNIKEDIELLNNEIKKILECEIILE